MHWYKRDCTSSNSDCPNDMAFKIISKMLVLFFFYSVFGTAAAMDIFSLAQFINDLIRNEEKPIVLNVQSCWTRDENAQFLQLAQMPLQFSTPSKRLERQISCSIWFVLQMNCKESLDILRQVN